MQDSGMVMVDTEIGDKEEGARSVAKDRAPWFTLQVRTSGDLVRTYLAPPKEPRNAPSLLHLLK